MAWYDRVMVVGLIVACIVLAVVLQSLGRNVADLDDRRTPVTITPATVPEGWSRCITPDGTEVWESTERCA